MPELPEVEVVKKSLENEICNFKLQDIEIIDGNLRYKVKHKELSKIIGFKVARIERRSKYLIFFFNQNDFIMICHLGMTGKFLIKNNQIKKKTSFYYDLSDHNKKHDRLIFTFNKKKRLIYNDIRKFGFIKIDLKKNINTNYHLKTLGPEPLTRFFNLKYFSSYIHNRDRSVKNIMMDQSFVSGLGNIYVNEILFLSKVKPNRNVKSLKKNEIKTIIKNTKRILKSAINLGGSTILNFSSSEGRKGTYQQKFKVYGRLGSQCSNSDCRGVIKKIEQSNRASFYCLKCQKY